uniref:Uncharacterized protein n=1 Tax=viral metagenome TaxID=1070528 RepID=A0A6C0BP17_9ZZZZ
MEDEEFDAFILEEFGGSTPSSSPPRIPRAGGVSEEQALAEQAAMVEEVNELSDAIRGDVILQLGREVVNYETGEIEMTPEVVEYLKQYLDDYYDLLKRVQDDFQKLKKKSQRDRFRERFSRRLKDLTRQELDEARDYIRQLRAEKPAPRPRRTPPSELAERLKTKLKNKEDLSPQEQRELMRLSDQTALNTAQTIRELEMELRKMAGRVTEQEFNPQRAGEEYRDIVLEPLQLSDDDEDELSSATVSSDEEELAAPSRPIRNDQEALDFCSRYARGAITEQESLEFIGYATRRKLLEPKALEEATIGELCALLKKRIEFERQRPSPSAAKQSKKAKQPAPAKKRERPEAKSGDKQPTRRVEKKSKLSKADLTARQEYATKLKRVKLTQLKNTGQIMRYPEFDTRIDALLAAELANPTDDYKVQWMQKLNQ